MLSRRLAKEKAHRQIILWQTIALIITVAVLVIIGITSGPRLKAYNDHVCKVTGGCGTQLKGAVTGAQAGVDWGLR